MTRRADIMRREVRRQTLAAAPELKDCIWSPYLGPRPERPYAEWRPITQPSGGGRLTDDTTTIELPRQVDVQVLNVTLGQPYRIDYNFTAVTSTPQAGASLTSIRDDLITKINADRDPVTAALVSSDTLRMTADTGGDLWRVIANGFHLQATATIGASLDIVKLTTGSLSMTASLNIYSAGVSAEGGTELPSSSSFSHDIDVEFRDDQISAEFGQVHLALTRIADPVNLDNVPPSQAAFESRTATDFMISMPYWKAKFIEEIGAVELTISTDKGQTTFTV